MFILVFSMTVICVYVCYVSTVEFDFSLPGVTSMSLDPHKVCLHLLMCIYVHVGMYPIYLFDCT